MSLSALDPRAAARRSADAEPRLRCRQLGPADFDAVVRLLCQGFSERTAAYWRVGLQRMAVRPSPNGVPRFGYVLDLGGEVVGVLLTIYSTAGDVEGAPLRCNLSSWYVDPRVRGAGVLLDSFAMSDRSVTYLNASPAPHTLPMHEARGFRRLGRGLLLALPALSRPGRGQRVRRWVDGRDQGLTAHDTALAREHIGYGCLCVVCTDAQGARLAIFVRRTLQLLPDRAPALRVPCLQLIYGPVGSEFSTWAGALGRHLLGRLMPLVLLDVESPLPGVTGRYFPDRKPRCVRGPHPAPVGDLTATEIAVFGP
ncbi:MAG: hypothetical protein INR65_14190 [Gluconacetobacter diazotrophicus]|nr:hypothetical protein [Gluconacetobacter diazotrophicus]